MLTRKPKIGEVLNYDSGMQQDQFMVTRFEENLMFYRNGKGEQAGPIIWRFHDGLNECLSHQETA